MKKTIILLGLLLVMNYTAFAEQRGIFMDFHGDINPKKDTVFTTDYYSIFYR